MLAELHQVEVRAGLLHHGLQLGDEGTRRVDAGFHQVAFATGETGPFPQGDPAAEASLDGGGADARGPAERVQREFVAMFGGEALHGGDDVGVGVFGVAVGNVAWL